MRFPTYRSKRHRAVTMTQLDAIQHHDDRRKNLVINYEIHGSSGSLVAEEVEGHLKKPINLTYTPIIAPLIVIDKATWGLTREGIQDKIRDIQIELYSLNAIANRKSLGLPISSTDNARLTNEDGTLRIPHLTRQLEAAHKLKEGFVDVSTIMQERVERGGGGEIDISKGEDLNALFKCNPNPGSPKQLQIAFTVLGHDSERMTHSNEITYPSGFPRNYIMPRTDNRVVEAVEVARTSDEGGSEQAPEEEGDDGDGSEQTMRANLLEDLFIECPKVLTTLEITQGEELRWGEGETSGDFSTLVVRRFAPWFAVNADPCLSLALHSYHHSGFYGKTGNYKKIFDVTSELRLLSFTQGGNKLQISETENLFDLFRDPAKGVRKELRMSYTIRGFSGTMRIEEEGGYLRSSIQIGYMPAERAKQVSSIGADNQVAASTAAGGAMAALKFLKKKKNNNGDANDNENSNKAGNTKGDGSGSAATSEDAGIT